MGDTDKVWVVQRTIPEAMLDDEQAMAATKASVEREWRARLGRIGRVPRETPRVTVVEPALKEITLLDEDGEPVLDENGEPVTVREPWLVICEGRYRRP